MLTESKNKRLFLVEPQQVFFTPSGSSGLMATIIQHLPNGKLET